MIPSDICDNKLSLLHHQSMGTRNSTQQIPKNKKSSQEKKDHNMRKKKLNAPSNQVKESLKEPDNGLEGLLNQYKFFPLNLSLVIKVTNLLRGDWKICCKQNFQIIHCYFHVPVPVRHSR